MLLGCFPFKNTPFQLTNDQGLAEQASFGSPSNFHVLLFHESQKGKVNRNVIEYVLLISGNARVTIGIEKPSNQPL